MATKNKDRKIATAFIASVSIFIVPSVGASTLSQSYIDPAPTHIAQPTIKDPLEATYIPNLPSHTSQFDKAKGELFSYFNLLEGWDGYQALEPNPDTINSTLAFLKLIELRNLLAPKTMLSSDGEVSLYWSKDDRHLEIGFDGDNKFSYLIDSERNTMGEDDLEVEDHIPVSIVQELIFFSKELTA